MTTKETPDLPTFVVVGNVNQGKSSIVATLSEDPTVPIDRFPGTTIKSGRYLFRAGERPIFALLDTPGFQEPRHVLAWLKERSQSVEDRQATVRAFLLAHEGGDRFQDEVELLKPIMAGAGIIYVVDGGARFQPANEAEMEILRWTGQPSLALINRTHAREAAYDWRPVLLQFFSAAEEFDAHHATFKERLELLRSFRTLRPDWRPALDEALHTMERDWKLREEQALRIVARLLTQSLSHIERERLPEDADEARVTEALATRYQEALREFEREARREIEALYRHGSLRAEEDPLDPTQADLFSETSWRAFGLSRGQLAKSAAIWGAAAGGAIDLAVGGLSFFVGAAIGGIGGGLAGWFGGSSLARTWGESSKLARAFIPGDLGRYRGMGPIQSPAFPWILLDRALLHLHSVRDRAHAQQAVLDLRQAAPSSTPSGLVTRLSGQVRAACDQAFRRILKRAQERGPQSTPDEQLLTALQDVLRAL